MRKQGMPNGSRPELDVDIQNINDASNDKHSSYLEKLTVLREILGIQATTEASWVQRRAEKIRSQLVGFSFTVQHKM